MTDNRRILPHVILPVDDRSGQPIVGGRPTRQFQDCCAVGNDEEYYCSGTLIAANVVISARHCTGATRIFLKGHDVDAPQYGETLRVARTYLHPEVDLMALVLDQSSSVPPRHVAQGPEVHGGKALLVGFGTIDVNGMLGYGIKRKVEVEIASLNCTGTDDAQLYGCISGKEIVAGHRGLNRDTCTGDSGGPLYIRAPRGGYYLLGATSRGVSNSEKCCGDGGVYVRVDLCLDWIRTQTGVEIND